MRRQTGEALRCLEEAERLTPEQTRTHRVARDLIQLSGSRPHPSYANLPNASVYCPNSDAPGSCTCAAE
jgi:hypothetical protein